ncbi:signal recognition particle protein [Caldithrix abyssi DSM 13497]|uniref:Signal recognition particle protein n=1 Tax=Caldithrix abyssi DSM 13497 TaxID=880073 RepID=H1XUW3_CALAY|nr:signal recognition particle protein [Caldithrix abyssi]APF17568.1 ffh signal recognition particle subunit FFH/SRP54 (srp54) [Caldithrix abyssi DSM 13497]EHO41662.1 signal recognition particle protein [Caldithrix abyssi DSM 13497]
MLEELTSKLESTFRRLRGYGKLTEKNIADSLKEIRRALLEADVNYKVVKDFVASVQKKAVGEEVLRSVTPGQMIVKIVHDEMVRLLGGTTATLKTAGIPPTIIMLVGLQGSGKTTFAAKLAKYLQKKNRKPLLVAADVYRPAAIQQLKILGRSINVPVYEEGIGDPVKIAFNAISYARQHMLDTIILDTAGRLHIDEQMMEELVKIKKRIRPHEILFVADGMTGQDAVNTASQFAERLNFDGVVLTKMDGDARGGAALSIKAITGKPIKFMGVGEKLEDIEQFHPDRMASRILGMGDVVTLVEKAQETIDQEKAAKLEQKLRKAEFDLEDFLDQLQQIKKMGSLESILRMIPGVGSQLKNAQVDEKNLVRVEAIINSMTKEERRNPKILNGSRRKRIAMGSGTRVQDVNQLMRQFEQMKKMMKQMKNKSFRGFGGMPFGMG